VTELKSGKFVFFLGGGRGKRDTNYREDKHRGVKGVSFHLICSHLKSKCVMAT
jgi:hypothetical protein